MCFLNERIYLIELQNSYTMKWLSNLFNITLRNNIRKSTNNSGLAEFEIGKRLYLNENIEEALYYTDLAVKMGVVGEVFVIRGCCL